jgi:LuxR family maltose regulon positive regulatory protein
MISAPAGYGKSTLLSDWVQQAEIPVSWLSLDVNDNDPTRFWTYFVAALRIIQSVGDAKLGEGFLAQLRLSPTPARESLYGELIQEIIAIPDRFVLILDDLHLVNEPEVLDGLYFLLDNIPAGMSGMHLIVSTRIDPPWPLARLRVSNQLNEMRTKDLRLTEEESSCFLNDIMSLELTAKEIAELDKRTEGWAAGLQMAALSIRGKEDIKGFLEGFSGSHRFVMDYLMEEILAQQTPLILEFLLKTSILSRMTGPLCDAITGDTSGSETLLKLEKANMFLTTLDEERHWYRYHPLFADLLQKQLQNRYPELVTELCRRASQWFAQAGFPQEAVNLALNSNDWDFAADQLEIHILNVIQHGEITLARQWISLLPDEVIHPRPMLDIAQAWTLAKYATVELAENFLFQAETALSKASVREGAYDLQIHDLVSKQIAILQAVIARARGDSTQIQQDLVLEALDHFIPENDLASQATLYSRLGLCYLDLGKDKKAKQIFARAMQLGQKSGNLIAANLASYGQMVIARRHGQLSDLFAICRKSLDTFRTNKDQHKPLDGIALTMLGGLYYEKNDLDQAERTLTQGLKLIEKVGLTELLIKCQYALACVKIVKRKMEPSPDLVQLAGGGSPRLASYAAALQARLYLLYARQTSDPNYSENAISWAGMQELSMRKEPTYDWEIYEKIVYAQILNSQYLASPDDLRKTRLEKTLDFIKVQLPALEELDWMGVLVEVYVVMAVILRSLERNVEALSAIKRALLLAESQGYVRTFVDEGEIMRILIQQVAIDEKHRVYTQNLLSAFDHPIDVVQPKMKMYQTDLVDPLSEREMQVLRYLNTQLSVPEIAGELHLSPATVRTHVQNIYRKLDVHGRIEALQKAKAFKLI